MHRPLVIAVIPIHLHILPCNSPRRSRTPGGQLTPLKAPHVTQITASPDDEAAADVRPGEADCHSLPRRRHAMFLSDGVNPPKPRKTQSSCPPYLPTASPPLTHTGSILTHPPQRSGPLPALEKTRQTGLQSLALFHLLSHVALRERTTAPVDCAEGGQEQQTVLQAAAAKRKHHR